MNLDGLAFKAAARRAWGRETAPAQLRATVERLLRTGPSGVDTTATTLGTTPLGRRDLPAGDDPLVCVVASTEDGTLVALPVARTPRDVPYGQALARAMDPNLTPPPATPN